MVKVRKFDIVVADLGQNLDSEQGGKRPVLIIQNNCGNKFSTTTIVMPLSSKSKALNQSTHTIIKKSDTTGLVNDSVVLGEQIRVISKKRIIRKLGSVKNEEEINEIKRVYWTTFGED